MSRRRSSASASPSPRRERTKSRQRQSRPSHRATRAPSHSKKGERMEERKIKAYGFNATVEYIEKNYDEAARKRIFGALSPAARDFLGTAKKQQWAPPAFSSELWTGIVKEQPNAEAAQDELIKVGRYQGSYATNTYLKLLMKMLTMRMFAKKFPDIWARDANFGKMVTGD